MADRDRDKRKIHTPPDGVKAQIAAVPRGEFNSEEVTGQITDPDALKAARERRPTRERIHRLEVARDQLVASVAGLASDVGDLNKSVGEMHGEMKVWPKLVDQLKETVDRSLAQQHMTFTARVDLDKAATGAKIDIDKAQAAAQVEVDRLAKLAEIDDAKAEKAHKREESKADAAVGRDLKKEYGLKILAGIVGAAGLIGTYLAGRGC